MSAAAAPVAASVTPALYVGKFYDDEDPTFDIRLSQEEFDEMLEEDKPSYCLLSSIGFTEAQLCAIEKLYKRDRELEADIDEVTNILLYTRVYPEQLQRAQEHLTQLEQEKVAHDEEVDKVFDLIVAALRRKKAE
jgi:hypothetical protein